MYTREWRDLSLKPPSPALSLSISTRTKHIKRYANIPNASRMQSSQSTIYSSQRRYSLKPLSLKSLNRPL
jgi:hypothetical protein